MFWVCLVFMIVDCLLRYEMVVVVSFVWKIRGVGFYCCVVVNRLGLIDVGCVINMGCVCFVYVLWRIDRVLFWC